MRIGRAEKVVLAEILARWGCHPDFHVRRNNVGALYDDEGRLVRFGLPGSADLEGFIRPRARFLAVECKTTSGELRKLQANYQALVERMGGVYIIARSEAQFAVEIAGVLERERAVTRQLAEVVV
jgi:hypothetical protein